jgi:capsular polysaccharide transport system permease protein
MRILIGREYSVIKRTPWQIQRAVIFALLMREIKTRFNGHWTGVVWMIGTPLLQTTALVFVNVYLRGHTGRESYDFAIYLLVALEPFKLCTGLWSTLMNGAKSNLGLFGYRQVKPLDTLIARAILETLIDFLVFVICIVLMDRIGFRPAVPDQPLAYLGVWLAFFLLGSGFGLVLSTLIGPAPKLGTVISLMSLPLMVFSGAIMPLPNLPQEYMNMLLMNPLMHLVELARAYYIKGYSPIQGVGFVVPLTYTLVFWFLGMSLYWIRRGKMAVGE